MRAMHSLDLRPPYPSKVDLKGESRCAYVPLIAYVELLLITN